MLQKYSNLTKMGTWITSTDVGENFFFRLISDALYYRASKNTNLTSVQFCKGRPVTPARCGAFCLG